MKWFTANYDQFAREVARKVKPEVAAKELLLRKKAREHLLDFIKYTKPSFQVGCHHQLICRVLEMVANEEELPNWGKVDRVILTAPPRHSKSEIVSVRFPAWYIGRHPDRQIIATSYESGLATGFGREVRNLVSSSEYQMVFPGTSLRQDSKAANRWHTTTGGVYIAAGFGSGITGKGMNVGIIDDYVKGRKEAKSSSWWAFVRDWYKNDFYTRMMPGGAIIIVATRWVKDDLVGWLTPKQFVDQLDELEEQGDRWLVINLPAEATTDNDILGRKLGEALWPEWYPLERLERIKRVLGPEYQALYQQEPVLIEGNIYKRDWWGWYDELPSEPRRIIDSWDTGFKAGKYNAYSANLTIAECRDGYYVLDWFRDKLEYPDLKATVLNRWLAKRSNPVLIEDKASGTPLIQELIRGTQIPVIPIPCNDKSKEERALAASPVVSAGKVKLPRFKQWANEFVEVMSAYPASEEKDTMDAFSQAVIWLNENSYSPPSYEQVVSRRFGVSMRGFV